MIAQIRADLYRQRHTLGTFITALLIVIYAILIVGFKTVGGVMVSATEKPLEALDNKSWSILDSIHAATLSSTVLLYLFIGLFTIVIGYEFNHHLYKNTLVSGLSRLQFILAKYFTLVVNFIIFMGLYYLTAFLSALIVQRPMGTSVGELLLALGTTLWTTTFFVSVIFSLAILVLIATSSLVISAVFVVLWPILIGTITLITNWHWLEYADFFGVANRIAFGLIRSDQLFGYIMVSFCVLVMSIFISTMLIRRKEL
ncbi:ABC transporter permease [Lapidilactobacillus bayanensis]|uniref:ABC transporter permease n=1 Tax=Lapidilactobacillus bayanensis TaxID=2485998 RepID=UPI000F788067|nr:ABC transporter permease [Lapidilactobacillus bayanensis]